MTDFAHAAAQGPAPGDDAHRLAVLDHELAMYASEGKRERLKSAITNGVLAAVLLPSGVVLTHRDDPLRQISGVGLIATSAVELATLVGTLFPSDLEQVAAHPAQRKASGKSAAEIVRETEAEWRHEAEVEHKAWIWAGSIQLGIGVAAIPVGLTMLLHDELGSMPHKRQINLGATLLGIGIPYVIGGATMLFTTSATEASWRASQGARASWVLQAARSVYVSPSRRGALLGAGGRF
jgi:hypothetical protein